MPDQAWKGFIDKSNANNKHSHLDTLCFPFVLPLALSFALCWLAAPLRFLDENRIFSRHITEQHV
jgi:hypothetical protein